MSICCKFFLEEVGRIKPINQKISSRKKDQYKYVIRRSTAICTQIFLQSSWNKYYSYSYCSLQQQRQSLKPQSTTYSCFSEVIYKSNRWVRMVWWPILPPLCNCISLPPLHLSQTISLAEMQESSLTLTVEFPELTMDGQFQVDHNHSRKILKAHPWLALSHQTTEIPKDMELHLIQGFDW